MHQLIAIAIELVMGKTPKRKRSALPKTFWVVFIDHSPGTAFRTKREAVAHARLYRRAGIDPYVVAYDLRGVKS